MSKKYVFSESDYISGDGMMTSVWGPAMWHVLHTISFNYPINPTDEQKKHYYHFYNNLQNILPCRYCRENLTKNLEKLPLTLDTLKNRDSLSRWVYDLHELINCMLDKKSGLTYYDVRDRYEHFRSRCVVDSSKNKRGKEVGCTEPLYGLKSKCVINIVPKNIKSGSFIMDPKCILKKEKTKKKTSTKTTKKKTSTKTKNKPK